MEKELGKDTVMLAKKNVFMTTFIPFSIIRNFGKYVSPQKPHFEDKLQQEEDNLRIFDGMKFWAFLWLVFANTYLFATYFVVKNTSDINTFYSQFLFTLVPFAYVAVDVFLFMSAAINTYNMLKLKEFDPLTILRLYAQRAMRFIPMIALIMFLGYVGVARMISGPISYLYLETFSGCAKHWWSNLLLVNNFYPAKYDSNCMWWTWYFSVDFQLFLCLPFVVLLLRKSKKIGYMLIGGVILASLTILTVHNALLATPGLTPTHNVEFLEKIYIKPWIRCVPYCIGAFIGAVYHSYILKTGPLQMSNWLKNNSLVRYALYVLGGALIILCYLVLYFYNRSF